jgi:hypothetical protein
MHTVLWACHENKSARCLLGERKENDLGIQNVVLVFMVLVSFSFPEGAAFEAQ